MRRRSESLAPVALEALEPRTLLSAVFTETMSSSDFFTRWSQTGSGVQLAPWFGDQEVRPRDNSGIRAEVFGFGADEDLEVRLDWRQNALNHAGRLRIGLVLDFVDLASGSTLLSLQANIVSGVDGGAFQWVIREGDQIRRFEQQRSAVEGTLFLRFDQASSTVSFSITSFDSGESFTLGGQDLNAMVVRPTIRRQWVSDERVSLSPTLSGFDNFVAETGRLTGQPVVVLTRGSPSHPDAPYTARDVQAGQVRDVTYFIRNAGYAPLLPAALRFTRNDLDAFSLVFVSQDPLPPGATATISLRIAPPDHSQMIVVGELTMFGGIISHGTPSRFSARVIPDFNPDHPDLVAYGLNGSDAQYAIEHDDRTPRHADGTRFGGKAPNEVISRDFVLFNVSDHALNVTSIQVQSDSGAFAVATQSFSILPRGSRIVRVEFLAGSLGAHTGVVQITSNDADTPSYVFKVRGTVLQEVPSLQVRGRADELSPWQFIRSGDDSPGRPNGTKFGATPLAASTSRTYRLSTTDTPLVLQEIRIVGSEGQFHVRDFVPGTLRVGDELDFSIDFTGAALGLARATVQIVWGPSSEFVLEFDIRATVV